MDNRATFAAHDFHENDTIRRKDNNCRKWLEWGGDLAQFRREETSLSPEHYTRKEATDDDDGSRIRGFSTQEDW